MVTGAAKMSLMERMGRTFTVTTELGPVKGALFQESINKAKEFFHGPYPSKPVYDYNTFELVKLIKKMNRGLDYNDKEFGESTAFAVACTAMPTARDLDRELKRMEKKIIAGADFFQTQVVYDVDKAVSFARKAKPLGKPILMGIMPLKSVKMAKYMKDHVEGIDVPDDVISRMVPSCFFGALHRKGAKDAKKNADSIFSFAFALWRSESRFSESR
jgi:5,10-methylenetetrahydrofolate reductase